jgi:hypothetical protein
MQSNPVQNQSRLTSRAFALLLAPLGCALLAAPVRAQESTYRVAVLELSTEQVGDALARSLTAQLRAAVEQTRGYELQDSRVSLEQLSLAHDCDGATPECLERIARALGVQGLVFGRVSNERGGAVARIQRFDVASRSVRGSALTTVATSDAAPEDLERKAKQLTADLFELEPARSPFARGESTGEPDRPLSLALRPSSGPSVRDVAGYALLGSAVLSAGMSVLSFVEIDRAQTNESFDRYRRSVGQARPSVRDVCDEAGANQSYGLDAASFQKVRNSCSAGRTFEILQFLFIGGAVISGGLSAYLLLGERSKEKPGPQTSKLTLRPHVYKSGAGLGARITF